MFVFLNILLRIRKNINIFDYFLLFSRGILFLIQDMRTFVTVCEILFFFLYSPKNIKKHFFTNTHVVFDNQVDLRWFNGW